MTLKYRRVEDADIDQIISLYKETLNFQMDKYLYKYLYFRNNKYISSVATNGSFVVGHNAIIENKYYYKNNEIIVGLSSGGMVNPLYSGIFYQILKFNISMFQGDCIIAFPNNNSEGFFKKIFNFNEIRQNYFTITKPIKNIVISNKEYSIERSEEFINWRINSHPRNKYEYLSKGDTIIIYKIYNKTEVDVLYVNKFGKHFITLINKLLRRWLKINIIHWDYKYLTELGFRPIVNNTFVYKNTTGAHNNVFECQMIDSDIF